MQVILNEYHENHNVPQLQRISVGVVSDGWVTLIGTPSSFARLVASSPEINNAPHIPTDVGGPSHTDSMPIPDIQEMVGKSTILNRTIDWSKVIMSDPAGGVDPCRHATLRDLVGEVLINILERPLRIDKATKNCSQRLRDAVSETGQVSKLIVHEMGKTPHMNFVQKSLKAANLTYELFSSNVPDLVDPEFSNTRGSSDLVAIVGMGGRFPENDTIDGFWKDLLAKRCHIKKIPKTRFDVDRYYDATHKLKNSTAAKEGAWLRDPGLFDHRFFNISPREAMQLDPVARLALTTTHEALEMAGYYPGATPSTNPDRVATFFGITGMDWTENLHQQGLDIYAVSSIAKAFIAGRINYTYKFGRGCYVLDAACASSTTAITLGVQGLLSRDCDMAVAGGGSVFSSPFAFSALSRSGMLAYEGGCRTFHDDADGYARSEGMGMVVLKRLEDALADNDNILGVIRGAARSYSTTSTSITHPSHVSQEKAFREVLGQSAVDPEEISYVEMHGTGTQAGDFEEMTSVLNIVGGQRNASNPLIVGAVKAAVGHGEGVAGVTSLIKMMMMLKHGQIPPQPGAPFKINSKFPRLDKRNVHVALEQSKLRASPKSRDGRVRMLLNSFDASGGICSLVIEEAPKLRVTKTPDPRNSHIVAVSARTAQSLRLNCERLLAYLNKSPDTCIEHLAYTTSARRMHHALRKAFVSSSVQDLKRQLVDYINTNAALSNTKKPKVPNVVFLFTGQGSEYTAVGKTLYETSKLFRSVLHTYQVCTKALGLPDFLPVIADDSLDLSTASPTQVQLAIVAVELAVTTVLRSWGIVPDIVIGHSLGEYAALCVCGVLSPSDTFYLVGQRAKLMEEHLDKNMYGMLATRMSGTDLETRIKKGQSQGKILSCHIACFNSPANTVVSGSVDDLTRLKGDLGDEGIQTTLLRVPFGFHSEQVDPVLPTFRKLAENAEFNKPRIPIISSLTGNLVTEAGVFNAHYLTRQAREPVNFLRALQSAETAGFNGTSSLWIESGPNPVLLGLAQKTLNMQSSQILPALKHGDDSWRTMANMLKSSYESGMAVQWPAYHGEFSASLRVLPDLPTYAWDYKDYWIPYTSPPAWEIEKALKGVQNANDGGQSANEQQIRNQLPSSTLHRLEDANFDEASKTMKAVFSSDTSVPALQNAIDGHVVNGHKITPLGVFCEAALAASKYCLIQLSKDANNAKIDPTTMKIADITLEHPVLLDGSSHPIILTTAICSAAENATKVVFEYKNEPSGTPKPVGECRVVFAPETNKSTGIPPALTQTVYLIKARIAQLQSLAATGKAHRLLRSVVYKMFSSYVKYSSSYHAIDEVFLSTDSEDAVASVTAPVTDDGSQYVCNPYIYDGVTHLAGFVINNGLRFDDPETICIADGFSDSYIWQPLVAGKQYITYVSVHEVPGSSGRFEGSCYVFRAEDNEIVGMYSGFRFRKMKKAVLDYVLGGSSATALRSRLSDSVHAVNNSHYQVSRSENGTNDRKRTAHVVATVSHATTTSAGNSETFLQPNKALASREPQVVDRIFEIAAAEAGCSIADMTDEANFDDLGIDSLLAIAVLSRCHHELNLDLPATFFLDNRTIGDAKQALAENHGLAPPGLSSAQSVRSDDSAQPPTPDDSEDQERLEVVAPGDVAHDSDKFARNNAEIDLDRLPEVKNIPEPLSTPTIPTREPFASSQLTSDGILTHLQGPEKASTTLFLLADETGSSSNYKQIPALDPSMSVFGVNWGLISNSDSDDKPNIESIAQMCALAMRTNVDFGSRTILGGVGVGGVLAVEVGRLLDKILGVIILDPAAASKDCIIQSMDRLKRMRILRPAQKKSMTLASSFMHGYKSPNVESDDVRLLCIASSTGDLDSSEPWVPKEVIYHDDLKSGCFLKQPDVLAGQLRELFRLWA
jgi:iterative type I PKS product template protein